LSSAISWQVIVLQSSAKTVALAVIKGKPPGNSGYRCGEFIWYWKCQKKCTVQLSHNTSTTQCEGMAVNVEEQLRKDMHVSTFPSNLTSWLMWWMWLNWMFH